LAYQRYFDRNVALVTGRLKDLPASQRVSLYHSMGRQERKKKSVCRYKPAFGNAGNTDAQNNRQRCAKGR
ncbi:hypothetical protein ACSLO9_32450, partial [Escherichia coli]